VEIKLNDAEARRYETAALPVVHRLVQLGLLLPEPAFTK
jgi:hypothetical protein